MQVGFICSQGCSQDPPGCFCAVGPETEGHSPVPTAWQCRRTNTHRGPTAFPCPPASTGAKRDKPQHEILPGFPGGCREVCMWHLTPKHSPRENNMSLSFQPKIAQQKQGFGSKEQENVGVAHPQMKGPHRWASQSSANHPMQPQSRHQKQPPTWPSSAANPTTVWIPAEALPNPTLTLNRRTNITQTPTSTPINLILPSALTRAATPTSPSVKGKTERNDLRGASHLRSTIWWPWPTAVCNL